MTTNIILFICNYKIILFVTYCGAAHYNHNILYTYTPIYLLHIAPPIEAYPLYLQHILPQIHNNNIRENKREKTGRMGVQILNVDCPI